MSALGWLEEGSVFHPCSTRNSETSSHETWKKPLKPLRLLHKKQ